MCTPPRGLRGWGCPRRAAGPSVPLSADTVSPPPPASVAGGGGPCLWGGEKGGCELAPRPRASVVGVSPFESFLAPQAAFGWCWPLGCRGLGMVSCRVAGGGPAGVVWGVWGRVFGPPSFTVLPLAGGASRRPAGPAAPPLPLRCLPSPPRVRGPCPLPAHPPWLSPCRDGRPAPEAESVGASAPRGRVPRRRPAGRRGVCPPLRALPPGCGRAAVRAPAARGRGLWRRWGREGTGEGVARCVRRPFGLRRPRVPQPRPPTRPVPRPPVRRPRPVRPVTAGSCSRPAPPRCLPLCARLPPAARRPPPPPAAAASLREGRRVGPERGRVV